MSGDSPVIPGLRVVERIGQGGFAVVWRALDEALGREVAVKVLSTRVTDETTAMRFERECRALGAVSGHPNIVTVHQVGTTGEGYPYLVMGYEPGGSLGARIATRPLPWREAVETGVKVADALEVAHRAGVLHRDVKPDNILVSRYGEPKLTDFGIARLVHGPHTSTSAGVTASVAHAPPEVLHGRSPDPSSDVYSLCSTLHALITGRPPFFNPADESLLPLITRIATQPPPPLPTPTPERLQQVLDRGMAKEPADRIRSAGKLAAELRTVLDPAAAPAAPAAPSVPFAPAVPGAPGSRGPVAPPGVAEATRRATAAVPSARAVPGAPSRASNPGDPGRGPDPTAPAASTAAPSPRRRNSALVGAGVLVALVAVGGLARLALDGDDSEPTTTTTSPNSTTSTRSAQATTSDGATTVDPSVATSGDDGSGLTDLGALESILLRTDDLDGSLQVDQATVLSPDDPDHPLLDYTECGGSLDLSRVGAGAVRTLIPDVLSIADPVVSSASVADSPEAAAAVIDEIVANTASCQSYEGATGTEVRVVEATETETGGRLDLVIRPLVGGEKELTVLLTAVDDLVVILEIDSNRPERDELNAVLLDRSAAYEG